MSDKRIQRLQTIVIKRLSGSAKIKSILQGASNVKEAFVPCLLQLIEEEVDGRDAVHTATMEDLGTMQTQLEDALKRIEALEAREAHRPSPKPG
jgi:hypothetical protein